MNKGISAAVASWITATATSTACRGSWAGMPTLQADRTTLVLINDQRFTKTANCWGVDNNEKGTNSNRIAVFARGPGRQFA